MRWILLGIGVLLVAGVYFWSRRSSRPRIEPGLSEPGDVMRGGVDLASEVAAGDIDTDDVAGLASAVEEPSGERLQEELEALEQLLGEEQPPSVAETAGNDGASVGSAPEAEKIVIFYLVAPRGQPFQGERLARVFDEAGLQFGDMEIYHRLAPGRLAQSVFSVANLLEPGTFDPTAMAGTNTPGLSIFLRLPGPVEPLAAFDDMLATARQLAERLQGELRDEERNRLSRQAAEHLREEIIEYQRRQQLERVPR
ncbi:cell division protein ZipA [Thiohalobacter sp. IOR34]|uniref:cell division protein ZipA n=1 Tax=Thiohalobacter sp. IOR34 TaxID=3057176 RepID=UPI0025B18498|nr:cell division protein ZipA [Thiohalobacter sp. IOR34]WJW76530.1 cell division protein ZipA [Thiohalobacter sp. IOR34]